MSMRYLRLVYLKIRELPRLWRLALLGVLLALVVLVGYWLWQRWYFKPIPAQQQPYSKIVPDSTSKSELMSTLAGAEPEAFELSDYEVTTVQSARSPYQPDRFYIKDDVVVLKEQWYEPSVYPYEAASFVSRYGQPTKEMYDSAALDAPLKAMLYPTRGLVVFAYEEDGLVRKVQYFSPMTMSRYLETWGKDLVETKPTGGLDHTEDSE